MNVNLSASASTFFAISYSVLSCLDLMSIPLEYRDG